MANNSQKSMLELAVTIVEAAKEPVAINEIISKVMEMGNIDDPKGDKRAQLYVDITTSSRFVYMGDGLWDLKSNQSLEAYDRDGVDFKGGDDDSSEDDGVSVDDYSTEEGVEASDDDEEASDSEIDDYEMKNPYADNSEEEDDDLDESEFDDIRDTPDQDDFDEDKYGDIMDSYEDLYDK